VNVLVIANETAASETLLDALRKRVTPGQDTVTVIAPVSEPRHGYVVYDDTRRASAGRRLDKTLRLLREAGIAAHGLVVETSPVQAVKDAFDQLDPPPDHIVVSTHPPERSAWVRRDVVEDIRRVAGPVQVEHVVAADAGEAVKNVLVIANETVVGEPLLERIRRRHEQGGASFLIVAPQSDDAPHPEAEKRLRRALASLRGAGVDAHGEIAHPDPYTAAMQATCDERVDEIIVSTFGRERSGWLRRDLVERLRRETGLPVEHVVVEQPQAERTASR
jgi:methylmalonyl-CoA mutase cobalamin-binding subunit